MKKLFLILLMSVIFASCTSAQTEIPTQAPLPTYTLYPTYTPLPTFTPYPTFTPFPTWTPEPTITPLPTQKPISEINVIDYLYMEGDLPAVYIVRLDTSNPPPRFDGIRNIDKVSYHQIARDFKDIGGIGVFLFEDIADAERAYTESVANVMGNFVMSYKDGTVGDKSRVTWFDFATVTAGGVRYVDYEFVHCGLVASITLTGRDYSLDQYVSIVTHYAEQLDSRLSPVVCGIQ